MNDKRSEQKNSSSEKLLEELYKNSKMGANSIIDLLPKVKDQNMRDELTSELDSFEKFAKEAETLLYEINTEPQEESLFARLGTKMSVAMNTMVDSTSSHIAEMMIKGATMGITEATKLLRESENSSCSEEALSLARRLIKYEEESIDRLKKFL